MHTVIHVTYIKNTKLCYGDFQIPCEKTAVASSIHVAYHLNEMPVFLASTNFQCVYIDGKGADESNVLVHLGLVPNFSV